MGVSILLNGKDITPGWRSMMHGLIREEFGTSDLILSPSDLTALERLRNTQCKETKEPPFDWSQDIAEAFDKIIGRIKKRGSATIRCRF